MNIEISAVPNVTTLHVLPVYFWNEDEMTESNLHMIISKFNTTVEVLSLLAIFIST